MSRRSRRRGVKDGQAWVGKAALGLIVLGVVAAAVLYASVRSYLYSDSFRRFLSRKASDATHVEGLFSPFRWDGLAVDTDRFDATGSGLVRSMRVEGLHTEVGLSGLRRRVWEIRGSRVQRLELDLNASQQDGALLTTDDLPSRRASAAPRSSWLPQEVELQGMDVGEVAIKAVLNQGPAAVAGVRARIEPGRKKGSYQLELADGSLRLPFALLPTLRLQRAGLNYQDKQIYIKHANATGWKEGNIELTGQWDTLERSYAFDGKVRGVKCEEVFNETWAKRFIGNMATSFTLANPAGAPVANGRLIVSDGTLTALPVLDALAAYADTRRFRVLVLSDACCDWRWKKDELYLSNLVLASEGLVRLEGSLYIRGRELDGTFRLGLAPGTLANIPGAETDVFLAGERGLVWAPLRITGTLDKPQEDLTDRLVAAAGQRMFDIIPETGERVIKFTRSWLDTGTIDKGAIDKGTKIIEEGGKAAVREVSGVLGGLLGTGGTAVPDAEPPPATPPTTPTPPKVPAVPKPRVPIPQVPKPPVPELPVPPVPVKP